MDLDPVADRNTAIDDVGTDILSVNGAFSLARRGVCCGVWLAAVVLSDTHPLSFGADTRAVSQLVFAQPHCLFGADSSVGHLGNCNPGRNGVGIGRLDVILGCGRFMVFSFHEVSTR